MHTINHRPYSVFTSLNEELQYAADKNYLFDLSYLGVIDVIGEGAAEFLQGQLSCDVREVNSQQMRRAAQCNLKGRILSLLDVIDWQGMRLIIPQDLIEETLSSLSKTAVLSRVQLQQASSIQLLGFYLANPNDLVPETISPSTADQHMVVADSLCSYRVDEHHYILLVDKHKIHSIREPFIKQQQWRGSLAWHQRQLQQARIEIYPDSRGLFLPHRLGLQLSGYLSFNKGCYKGQEIIARTHYRATLKHGLRIFVHQTESVLHSGMSIMDEHNQTEVGELIDFCPLENSRYLIAASMLLDHSAAVIL